MSKNIKQQKRSNKQQITQIIKPPQLKTKTYSFNDPLYQSFGDYSQHNPNLKNGKKVQANYQNLATQSYEIYTSQNDSDLMSQLLDISERISLMSKMLQINKQITNPSVLMVNSQNKMKTEMLIETKRMNNDQNSIILCENATKYLTFLEVLNQEQKFYDKSIKNHMYFYQYTGQKYEQQRAEKSQQIHEMHFGELIQQRVNKFGLTQKQILRQNFFNQKGDQNFIFTHDNSRNLSSNPKTTNFSSGFSTAEKMFQGIKTPQSQIIEGQSSFIFTPLKQQKQYQGHFGNFQNESKRTQSWKSPQSSAILQVKKDTKKPQEQQIHTFNKKIQLKSKTKSPLNNEKVKMGNISISKSKSKNDKAKQNFINEKKQKSQDAKIKKKDRSFTNFQSMIDSKNLAYKTLNKTNQFEKMLKMASSRINQS